MLESLITSMNDLVRTAPALDKNYIVYRFVNTDEFISNLKVGDIFVEKGLCNSIQSGLSPSSSDKVLEFKAMNSEITGFC